MRFWVERWEQDRLKGMQRLEQQSWRQGPSALLSASAAVKLVASSLSHRSLHATVERKVISHTMKVSIEPRYVVEQIQSPVAAIVQQVISKVVGPFKNNPQLLRQLPAFQRLLVFHN
jgi:hypothetical protein